MHGSTYFNSIIADIADGSKVRRNENENRGEDQQAHCQPGEKLWEKRV
jgi:hypothetical protein